MNPFPDMERASKLLGHLGMPGDTISHEEIACAAWPKAVGKKVAAHTRATRMVRSSLIVEVEDRVWQQQLFTLRHQINRALDERIGPGIVCEIEFRIVALRRGPQRAEIADPAAQVSPADDAEQITDPVLRQIYKSARRKETA
jgi:acyl-CoA hydrolase